MQPVVGRVDDGEGAWSGIENRRRRQAAVRAQGWTGPKQEGRFVG